VQEGPWSWYPAVGEVQFGFFYEDEDNPGPSDGYINLTYTYGQGIFQFNISEVVDDAPVTNFHDNITNYAVQVGVTYSVFFIADEPGGFMFHLTSSFNQSFDLGPISVNPGSASILALPLTNPPFIDQTGRSNDTNINGTTTVTLYSDGVPAPGITVDFYCADGLGDCNFFVDGVGPLGFAGNGVTDENGQLNVTLQSSIGGPKQVYFSVLIDGTFLLDVVDWTVNQLVECQGLSMGFYNEQDTSFSPGYNQEFYVGQIVEAAVQPFDIQGNVYTQQGPDDMLTVNVVIANQTTASYGANYGTIITVPATPSSIVTATYLMTFNTCPVVTQTATWLWGIDCEAADIFDPTSGDFYDEDSGMEIYAMFPPLPNALVEGITVTFSGYNDAGDTATATIADGEGDVSTTVFYTSGDIETPNISVWVQDVYSQSAGCYVTVQPTWTSSTTT
jgi:hypothetical protein